MTEPSRPHRISQRDLGIAAAYAAAAAVLWGLQTALGDLVAPPLGLPRPLVLLLLLAASAGIVMRRRQPGAMFGLTGGFGLAAMLLNGGLGAAIVQFEAVYSAVLNGSRRLAGAVALLCAGFTLAVVLVALVVVDLRPNAFSLVAQALLILILPLLWAGEVRRHREARAQAERTAAAERDLAARQLELEQARAALRLQEQRTRLAQELHDGVTGHLSAVALQTGALRSSPTLRDDPAALDRSLETVRASALEAMADMRRLIDVLRTDGPQPGAWPSGGSRREESALGRSAPDNSMADGSRGPAAASWDGLIARLRALRPEAQIEVDPAAVAHLDRCGISAQALRIGQESVTNLLKHAGPGPVSLTLRRDAGALVLSTDSPLPPCDRPEVGAGLGLPSMRRRAAETGGALEVGPVDERTWRVRVRWPARSSSASASASAASRPAPGRSAPSQSARSMPAAAPSAEPAP